MRQDPGKPETVQFSKGNSGHRIKWASVKCLGQDCLLKLSFTKAMTEFGYRYSSAIIFHWVEKCKEIVCPLEVRDLHLKQKRATAWGLGPRVIQATAFLCGLGHLGAIKLANVTRRLFFFTVIQQYDCVRTFSKVRCFLLSLPQGYPVIDLSEEKETERERWSFELLFF